MAVGRNDPCPCGSGKKYKKCCMEADERASADARASASALLQPTGAPEPTLSPWAETAGAVDAETAAAYDAAAEAFDARFTHASFDERATLFRSVLDEPWLTDDDAFHAIDALYEAAGELGARVVVDELIGALREHRPELWQADAADYLTWQVGNALADGRHDALPPLIEALGPLAPTQPDTFTAVLDELAFAGLTEQAEDLISAALPQIAAAGGIHAEAKSGFVDRAFKYLLFRLLDRDPATALADPGLQTMLTALGSDSDPTFLEGLAGRLKGELKTDWKLSLLQPERPKPGRRPLTGQRVVKRVPPIDPLQLYFLGAEFVGYLHHVEGVPYVRAELSGQEIARYLADRQAGRLEGNFSYQREPRPRPPVRALAELLLPDRTTLDRYVEDDFDRYTAAFHRVAAALVGLPAWLRFLTERGVIDEARAAITQASLAGLPDDIFSQWELGADELLLQREVERAWPAADSGSPQPA